MIGQRMYSDPEELQRAIDDYFSTITNPDTRQYIRPPSHVGLALHLGFASRQSLYDYVGRDDACSYPIRRAMTRIEEFTVEQAMIRDKCQGVVFILKNMGYADRQDMHIAGEMSSVTRTELPSKKPIGGKTDADQA